jgi:hypothetical protein
MNHPVIRSIAALLLVALPIDSMAQELASSDPMVVIDLRPKEERDGNGLIELAGKCNRNVFRIADVATDPLKVDVLKEALSRQLGLAGDGKTLTVLNWSIYYNKTAAHGGGGLLQSVGVQGYAIPTGKKGEKQQGSKCTRAESAGGWFEAGDVNSSYPPLVSEFVGTFAGKPLNIRIVYSSRRKIAGKFEGSADDTEALLAAVDRTAEAMALAIVQ